MLSECFFGVVQPFFVGWKIFFLCHFPSGSAKSLVECGIAVNAEKIIDWSFVNP